MADDTREKYQRATDGFDAVIRAVPAEKWEAQSPCTEWQARDVAGHVIGIQEMVLGWASTGERPSLDWTKNRERAGADPVAVWSQARDTMLAALTPEALERKVQSGLMGEVPLRQLLQLFIGDTVIHTWDLAQATGQQVRLDPQIVSELFTATKAAPPDMLRSAGGFGPELPAPEGADEQTRLLAFLGRKAS